MAELDRAFGRAVALLREQQGKSQLEVAQTLGYQQPFISKLEHGERTLKVTDIMPLAEALEVPCEVLCSLIDRLLADDSI